MKMQIEVPGARVKYRSDQVVKETGIFAQDCEDECAELFDFGTEEYEDCVDVCEEEG